MKQYRNIAKPFGGRVSIPYFAATDYDWTFGVPGPLVPGYASITIAAHSLAVLVRSEVETIAPMIEMGKALQPLSDRKE